MLKIRLSTATMIILSCLVAVFFTDRISAGDSSLYSLENGLSKLVCSVSRSVVTVEASRRIQASLFEGAADEAVQRLISSGIVFDSAGHILVAATSVAGRDRITVSFEGRVMAGRLVGIDYHTGLAVLAVADHIGSPARHSAHYTCAGQMVLAVGNAYGLRACPSIGFCAGARPDGALQFSAPITSGTIGGGLFDLSGSLVGVITGGIGEGQPAEVGLAMPVYKIRPAVEYVLTKGDRMAGYIGVETVDIEISPGIEIGSPNQFAAAGSQHYTIIDRGTLITDIVPASPAARAGLRKGDLIFRVDDSPITCVSELMNEVRGRRPGAVLEVGFVRQNSSYFTRLKVGQRKLTTGGWLSGSTTADRSRATADDSLYREINRLKQTLRHIESRLRTLHR